MIPTPPIALRFLTLNLLVLFLPVAGIWSLAAFEEQLLVQEERAMVAQARAIASAALEIEPPPAEGPPAHPWRPWRERIARIERPLEGRVRIVDREGRITVDTAAASAGGAGEVATGVAKRPATELWVYRLGRRLWRFAAALRGRTLGSSPGDGSYSNGIEADPLPRSAIRSALSGKYGAQTQLSSEGHLLLLASAVPIRDAGGSVIGAVVVSRTTLSILRALDRVRVQLFRWLLGSLALAVVLSLWFARGLALPLRQLARESAASLGPRGRPREEYSGRQRSDEIGELARALGRLSQDVGRRIHDLEAFAADVAHELRNPLAGVRSASELLAESSDEAERQRLVKVLTQESLRMERLLATLRDLARVEAEAASEGVFDGSAVVAERTGHDGFESSPGLVLRGSEERFAQVVDNLVANARELAPPESVEVRLTRAADPNWAILEVSDRGPGIPEDHRHRIFERFFTYRPGTSSGDHLGLGLGIVRAIVERHGGTVTAENRAGGGASFRVTWPVARS